MAFKPHGIVVPIVTPVTQDGKFNEKAYRDLIEYLASSGIHGVFPFGTTGEFYAHDMGFYREVLAVTKDAVRGRMDIYAGANNITTRGAVEIAKAVEQVGGIDALSVLTPMFVSQTQYEVYEYYREIASETNLPIIIYNNRPKTNGTVEPATVAKLAEIDNIIGVKDSTGDMTNTEEYLRLTRGMDNFHVMMGRDTLIYAALCYGASGAIASCANVAPRIAVDIYEKFRAGDAAGANICASSADTVKNVDLVITMLPNSPQVKSVMLEEDKLADAMPKTAVFIDCSSINPVASREIAAELEKRGIDMLDAPVSGGQPKAIDGTLSFMVGGKEEVFNRFKPVLASMGSSVVLCGGIGAGNVTKLCNQTIVAVNIAVLAEAMQMGQMCGVEPQKIFEAIRGGLAGSTVMNAKAPMMMDQNFEPGFRIDLHIKDLKNVVDAASAVDAPIPLTQAVLEMMKVLHKDGCGACDHSALLKYYQKLTGEVLHH